MTLHVTQRTVHRPGRAAHRVELALACPHGRHECGVSIPEADGMPTAMLAEVTLQATHHLIHHVMERHRQTTGCTCTERLGFFCWPTTHTISPQSLGLGGEQHVERRR